MELVTVQLDKERHLKLTARGMLGFQTLTGKSLFGGIDLKDIEFKEFMALLWACLVHEDKELKYDDVLDMVEIGHMPLLTKAISRCIVQSFPDAKEGEEAPLVPSPQSS